MYINVYIYNLETIGKGGLAIFVIKHQPIKHMTYAINLSFSKKKIKGQDLV